jgi:cytochrome c2
MKKAALLSFQTQGQLTICLVLFSLMLALCGCAPSRTENVARVTGGNPVVGKVQIVRHGCPACHEISGIETARARVGPSLRNIVGQEYLTGQLVNTPDNMIRWVRTPQGIRPNSAMPDMGISEEEARDITAYLYSLP